MLLGSNLPNSLFPLYATVSLPAGSDTFVCHVHAAGDPSAACVGALSDAKGRREVLVGAIIVAGLAAGLFAAANAVAVLFIAQAVQAMALGALQGTAPRRWSSTTPPNSHDAPRWSPQHSRSRERRPDRCSQACWASTPSSRCDFVT
ncbi:MAG: MFS transporter [Solirubrobacteraceae bacterium]